MKHATKKPPFAFPVPHDYHGCQFDLKAVRPLSETRKSTVAIAALLACYALLTLDPLSVVHIRVSYDISRAITAMQNQHLPDQLTRIVSEGRSPDDISGHGNSA